MSENTTFSIKISGDALAAIPRLKDKVGAARAIATRMDRENQLTVARIQRIYLSFPKAGPATLEGLRVQTNRLRGSIRATKCLVVADGTESSIGSNVAYAATHEFGADIPSRPTRSKNKSYAKKHPNTKAFTLPARRPIQRGIEDRLPDYNAAISAAIMNFWKAEGGAA